MKKSPFIIISSSENVQEGYKDLDINRIELYRHLVQLRMVYYENGFRTHLDVLNRIYFGKYFSEASYSERRKFFSIWNMPSLNGILSIQHLLMEGVECNIINDFDAEYDVLKNLLSDTDIQIVGISTTFILQWSEIKRITKQILKDFPYVIFILGGAFVHNQNRMKGFASFEKSMKKYGIRFILHGNDADTAIVQIYNTLINKQSEFGSIKNLVYLDDQGVFHNNRCHDVAQNPWFDPEVFRRSISIFHNNIIQLRVSIGCPFKCAFCSYPSMASQFQCSENDFIEKTLITLEDAGIKNLVFIDDTLNASRRFFSTLLERLNNHNFKWYAFLRAQFITDEIAAEMADSGCDGVYLGLESGDNDILMRMNKKANIGNYEKGIESIKKHGITTFASFIVGFPMETENTINNTINFINRSGLDYYSLKEFYYLHNSPVHLQRGKYGLEGEGFKWIHETMSSDEASRMKLYMHDKINNCLYVDSDLGLWYLIYLRSRSFSWEQISYYQHIIDKITREDNLSCFSHSSDISEQLRNIKDMVVIDDD
ncbi:MAG: radical SAM protein [Pseudomonadota bacterium]